VEVAVAGDDEDIDEEDAGDDEEIDGAGNDVVSNYEDKKVKEPSDGENIEKPYILIILGTYKVIVSEFKRTFK
jgi:hypothetical protein